MCLLHSNAIADEGFNQLKKNGDRTNYEQRLAKMAEDDDTTQKGGLALLYKPVDVWQKLPKLRDVRKYRIGRHRFYFTGEHTDCNYTVFLVMVYKRDEDDKPRDENFQKKLLSALRSDTPMRIIPPPISEE